MFGKIESNDLESDSSLSRNNNFASFFQAVLVLFRSATGKSYVNVHKCLVIEFLFHLGEAWQEIMMDCADTKKARCDRRLNRTESQFCGSNTAYPYFISFYVLCSFLVSYFPHFIYVLCPNFLLENFIYYQTYPFSSMDNI